MSMSLVIEFINFDFKSPDESLFLIKNNYQVLESTARLFEELPHNDDYEISFQTSPLNKE